MAELLSMTPVQKAIHDTTAATALRLERSIAIARICFFSVILARFFMVTMQPLPGLLVTSGSLTFGILLSFYILLFVRKPVVGDRVWVTSVIADTLAVVGSLLPSTLWPSPQYHGLDCTPDMAGFFIAALSAGLRLSPLAAIVGAAANTLGMVSLIVADRLVHGLRFATGIENTSLSLVLIAGCGALAVILAVTTHNLVRRSALAALRAERAKQGLGVVLADHHDLGSLLTSAQCSADALLMKLERAGSSKFDPIEELRGLALDLRQVNAVVHDLKLRALGDFIALKDNLAVDVNEVVELVMRQVKTRFADVRIETAELPPGTRALIVGGLPTLHRILLNLLVNACEGDGAKGCSLVSISVKPDAHRGLVDIIVQDNGVGFVGAVAASGLQSPKPGSTGVGLSIVKGLVEESGGSVRFDDRRGRGSRVTITLTKATTT